MMPMINVGILMDRAANKCGTRPRQNMNGTHCELNPYGGLDSPAPMRSAYPTTKLESAAPHAGIGLPGKFGCLGCELFCPMPRVQATRDTNLQTIRDTIRDTQPGTPDCICKSTNFVFGTALVLFITSARKQHRVQCVGVALV